MTNRPSSSHEREPIPFPVRRASPAPGRVSLVGAGPGILAHARAGAERIYVGKRAGRHALPESAINELLVARARRSRGGAA